MPLNGDQTYAFLNKRHSKYLQRCLQVVPFTAASYDTSRMTVLFFALSGLDILNALKERPEEEKSYMIEWIYSLQVPPSKYDKYHGGFRGGLSLLIPCEDASSSVRELHCGHIVMTYTALASLLILGDDLSKVDRIGIQKHIRSLQCSDGSFYSTGGGSENDMRFIYCAATVCYILQDFSALNIDAAVKYIIRSISFEGAIGQGPDQESHGGSTYCGLAALYLMNRMDDLSSHQKEKLMRWLLFRQHSFEGGLQGRPNKPADTCYAWWVGASLKLLGGFNYLDHKSLIQFVLSTQDPVTGGLGKHPGSVADGLHTYLGISGLALIDNKVSELDLESVDPSLNISNRALEHLLNLHKSWLLES